MITLNPHRSYTKFHGWHRDHRTTARVVLDCVYPLARDRMTFPELSPHYQPHTVRKVYTIQWEQPSLVVDITAAIEVKLEAIRCHGSQIGDMKAFEERMRTCATTLGKEKGYASAEGFASKPRTRQLSISRVDVTSDRVAESVTTGNRAPSWRPTTERVAPRVIGGRAPPWLHYAWLFQSETAVGSPVNYVRSRCLSDGAMQRETASGAASLE